MLTQYLCWSWQHYQSFRCTVPSHRSHRSLRNLGPRLKIKGHWWRQSASWMHFNLLTALEMIQQWGAFRLHMVPICPPNLSLLSTRRQFAESCCKALLERCVLFCGYSVLFSWWLLQALRARWASWKHLKPRNVFWEDEQLCYRAILYFVSWGFLPQ